MKINKKQFKEKLANVLKSISKEATTKLSLLEAFGTFIFTGFFLVLFTIGFNGVANVLRWIIAITIVSLIYEWIVKGRKK